MESRLCFVIQISKLKTSYVYDSKQEWIKLYPHGPLCTDWGAFKERWRSIFGSENAALV